VEEEQEDNSGDGSHATQRRVVELSLERFPLQGALGGGGGGVGGGWWW
jgi:hypothetical protein